MKIKLPAVKYKDVPPGTLFTDSNGEHLYAMTFQSTTSGAKVALALTRNNVVERMQYRDSGSIMPVTKQVINDATLMKTFNADSLRGLDDMACYPVAHDRPIKEIV